MHTPGPWELNDGGNSIVVSGGPNHDDIADFSFSDEHTVSITREEALANARLFVAAPMMLALLRRAGADTLSLTERQLAAYESFAAGMRAINAILGAPG